MLDVASLAKFDFLKNLVLVSGTKGLYRNITNVVILDYEGIEGDFSGFHEGDFVITNLLFAKNDISKIYPAFEALIHIGVSAFAIKTVLFDKLPDDILSLTKRYEIPVFLFNNIYIEDVILSITDHLRSSANYNYYEDLIDSFIAAPSHTPQTNELLNALLPGADTFSNTKNVTALYLLSHNEPDEFSLQRNINKLIVSAKHLKTAADLHILKYKKGILLLYFSSETDCLTAWNTIMRELSLSSYAAGLSDTALPLSKIDIAVERSINACRLAVKQHCGPVKYSQLGLYNFIFSLCKDKYSCEFLNEKKTVLYEKKNKSLADTLTELTIQHFDIDDTAAALFQHPNTIRYRIGKLKDLFNVKSDLEFQILCVLIFYTDTPL